MCIATWSGVGAGGLELEVMVAPRDRFSRRHAIASRLREEKVPSGRSRRGRTGGQEE